MCVCMFTHVWRPEDIWSYPSGNITILFYLVTGYLTGWNSPSRLDWLVKEQKRSAHIQSPDHHTHTLQWDREQAPSCPAMFRCVLELYWVTFPFPVFYGTFFFYWSKAYTEHSILFIFTWMRSKSWNNTSEAHLFHSNHRSFSQGTKIRRSSILSKWNFSLSIMLSEWFIGDVISICSKI